MSIITKTSSYIFLTTFVFFLALWYLNPSNYIVAASFFVLIFIYDYKIRDIRLSLLLALLASTIVLTGKSYPIQLIPKGVLPLEIYPFGYFARFTITSTQMLSAIAVLVIIRDFANGKIKNFKLKSYELILVFYFLWTVISDYIGSGVPSFSLLFSLAGLTTLIMYFYIRLYVVRKKEFIKIFIYLLSALLMFESFISFQQFFAKSPIGKVLESQQGIEYFGRTVDEILFTFRPSGTFGHANALGIWLSSYLVILTVFFLIRPNYLFTTTILAGTAAIILTLSRSSWIGLFIGVVTVLFVLEKIRKRRVSEKINRYLPWFIFLAIPLFIFIILPRVEKSAFTFSQGGGYFREVQTKKALELIYKNPVFGVGSERSVPEGLKLVSPKDPNFSILADVHNWFLRLIVEHGIPALLLFLTLIYLYFKNLLTKTKFSLEGLGLAAGILATLTAGLFQPYINFQLIILALAFL